MAYVSNLPVTVLTNGPLPRVAAQLLDAVRARSAGKTPNGARYSDAGVKVVCPILVAGLEPVIGSFVLSDGRSLVAGSMRRSEIIASRILDADAVLDGRHGGACAM